MKNLNRILLMFGLLFLFGMTACDDEGDDEQESSELYLNFKIDGAPKSFSSTTGYWGGTTGGGDTDIYAMVDGSSTEVSFNFKNLSEITGATILSLNGQQIPFDDSEDIYATLIVDENPIEAYTYLADNTSPAIS